MTFWFILIAASPAFVLVPVGVAHHRRERLLRTSGTHADGLILELGRSEDGMGGGSNWAKVEYTGDGGSTRVAKVLVRYGFGDYRVGQRVDLTYVPGRRIVRLDP